MEREGFVFYRSFFDGLKELTSDADFRAAVMAICRYGLDGTEEAESGVAKMALAFAKPQIDANNRRYENGKRGGRSRQAESEVNQSEVNTNQNEPNTNQSEASTDQTEPNRNQTEPNTNQTEPNRNQSEPNRNQTEPKEKEKVKEKEKDIKDIVADVIGYLNRKCGKNYSPKTDATVSAIKARLKDGYTVEQIKSVIDKKHAEWNGTQFEDYLRPQTLFRPSNFESYVNQKARGKPPDRNAFNRFPQRDYDFATLENELLGG